MLALAGLAGMEAAIAGFHLVTEGLCRGFWKQRHASQPAAKNANLGFGVHAAGRVPSDTALRSFPGTCFKRGCSTPLPGIARLGSMMLGNRRETVLVAVHHLTYRQLTLFCEDSDR